MTVLADVYTAIHHVIKPLTLIAVGSKVNSHIQELKILKNIFTENKKGVVGNSCIISCRPSVTTHCCSPEWKEKCSFGAWFNFISARHTLACQGLSDTPYSHQRKKSVVRVWAHIVWGDFVIWAKAGAVAGCAQESAGQSTDWQHSNYPSG